MNKLRKLMVLQLLLLMPLVHALQSDYNIILEENGNALVVVEISGKGLVNIPLQEDVVDVKVKGALYTLNDDGIDVSIGSTEKAIVLYKTSLLTSKQGRIWKFYLDVAEANRVEVSMPKNAVIISTDPEALIESESFTKVIWEGSLQSLSFSYSFPEEPVMIEENESKGWMIFAVGLVLATVSLLVLYKKKETKPKKSDKENIIKTLSENEKIVVKTLLEKNGEIKRNELEKMSKLAKSSLAHALNTLEQKKIIEIDKTYTVHYVKFTEWFNEI